MFYWLENYLLICIRFFQLNNIPRQFEYCVCLACIGQTIQYALAKHKFGNVNTIVEFTKKHHQYWKLVHLLTLKNIFPLSALKIAPLFASYPFGLSDVLHGDEVLIFFDTVLPGAGLERENLSLTWTFIISMQINLKSNFKFLVYSSTRKKYKENTSYISNRHVI